MSVNDLLKAHMDAVRNITPTNDKLSISDATEILKKPQLVDTISFTNLIPNQATMQVLDNGTYRYTSTAENWNVGGYIGSYTIKPGPYIFECMIRGDFTLTRLAEENSGQIVTKILLDEKKWKILRIPFLSAGKAIFDIYGTVTKGQWFEVSQLRFIKME